MLSVILIFVSYPSQHSWEVACIIVSYHLNVSLFYQVYQEKEIVANINKWINKQIQEWVNEGMNK